jgi:uncharacterized DUF497 family protein
VSYNFEWDPKKAASNLKDHDVPFEEATTVFGDMLSLNMPDPDHSKGEQRFLVLGMSEKSRLVVVSTLNGPPGHESSAPDSPPATNGETMRTNNSKKRTADTGTMRSEYDFSNAVRGVTAARYAKGTNVVLLDPDIAELFPDSRAVNEALRTFARLARSPRRPKARTRRTA